MANLTGQGASPSAPEPSLRKARKRLERKERLLHPRPPRPPQPPRAPDAPRLGRPPKPRLMEVTLQMRHSINGRFFGPGVVRVTEKEAQHFLRTEHDAAEKELSLQRQEAFVISYGPHGGVMKRQVPWAQFDTILAREELPLDQLSMEARR